MIRSLYQKSSPLLAGLLIPSISLAQQAPEPVQAEKPAPVAAEATGEASTASPATLDTGVGVTAAPAEPTPAPAADEPPMVEPSPPVSQPEAVPAAGEVAPPAPEEEVAPSLLPLKVGTHTWSRFEARENYSDLGVSRTRFQEGSQAVFRTRLTLETAPLKLNDSVEGLVYIAPQASGNWGSQGIGGTIGEASAGIYEGYVLLRGKMLETKVGRFAMNYGDALMVGNLDWHQSGRAFDGLHVRLKPGAVTVDGFLTQTAEGHPGQNAKLFQGDGFFWGIYASLGKAIAKGLDLDAYLLGRSTAARDVSDDATPPTITHKDAATFISPGLRIKQKVSSFDYRLEAGLQVGKTVGPATENIDKFAYQVDGEVGVSFAKSMRISLGGAVASGNDPDTADKNEAWDELYPTTHKWFGLMDVIGFRTNVASANLKFKGNITDTTIFKIDGHLFARMEDGGLGQVGSDKLAGYEIDTQLVQKIGKFAYVRGLYGVFLGNSDYYASSKAAHYVAAQTGLKF